MNAIRVVIGGLLLVLGRKLFWLFVAASGFAVGLTVATQLLHVRPEWVGLLVGLAVGALGALVAIFLQRLAVAVAGFLAGAYIAVSLASTLGVTGTGMAWIILIIGGILGAALIAGIFEWALIGLSSLAGASLIVEGLHLAPGTALLAGAVLFVVGVIIQAAIRHQETH